MTPRKITCPDCGMSTTLLPASGRTYEQLYREVAITHEQNSCRHHGYADWGFDPEWDVPPQPAMIKHAVRMRIIQHPDGYMLSVPAAWDADAVAMHIERTRRKRRA